MILGLLLVSAAGCGVTFSVPPGDPSGEVDPSAFVGTWIPEEVTHTVTSPIEISADGNVATVTDVVSSTTMGQFRGVEIGDGVVAYFPYRDAWRIFRVRLIDDDQRMELTTIDPDVLRSDIESNEITGTISVDGLIRVTADTEALAGYLTGHPAVWLSESGYYSREEIESPSMTIAERTRPPKELWQS
ncbi:MAG: hypothetical protein IPG72_07130 [Ardenticatenales bacterium]|nr:hypothetical protein [Ardenticatenales bacterium]